MSPDPAVASRSQRAAAASLPSLGLIAFSFFLPFVRVCSNMETPIHYVSESEPLTALWIAPRFLVAVMLGVPIALALLRGRAPGRLAAAVGFSGIAAVAASMGLEWALYGDAVGHGASSPMWLAWLSLTSLAGILATVRAIRGRGWDRSISLVGAYALFASPLCLLVLDGLIYSNRSRAVGIGGYGFLIAIVLLIVLFAIALWPGRPREEAPGDAPPPPPADDPPPPVDAPN